MLSVLLVLLSCPTLKKEIMNFINILFEIPFCLFSSFSGNIQTDCIYSVHILMQNFLNLVPMQIIFQMLLHYLNEIWTPHQHCSKVHTLLLFAMYVTYYFSNIYSSHSLICIFFLKLFSLQLFLHNVFMLSQKTWMLM